MKFFFFPSSIRYHGHNTINTLLLRAKPQKKGWLCYLFLNRIFASLPIQTQTTQHNAYLTFSTKLNSTKPNQGQRKQVPLCCLLFCALHATGRENAKGGEEVNSNATLLQSQQREQITKGR